MGHQYWQGTAFVEHTVPAMISRHFDETLSIYCGGIDNLYRHHDYTLAILESIRPYPMARFWLHVITCCQRPEDVQEQGEYILYRYAFKGRL